MSRSKVLTVLVVLGLLSLLTAIGVAWAQAGTGDVTIRDSQAPSTQTAYQANLSDKAWIKLTNVPTLPSNKAYEGWLVSDDGSTKQSTGILKVVDGTIDQSFSMGGANAGENLFARFDKFVITVEPIPDTDPGPAADVPYKHQIPAGGILHIRHLLYSLGGNPAYTVGFHTGQPKGIIVGLRENTWIAKLHARLSVDSDTLADVKQHAEHVINAIEGKTGNYADHDGNGTIEDFGDGFGVLPYAAAAIAHAELASEAAATDATVVDNHARVVNSATQVDSLATKARDQAMAALTATDLIAAKLRVGNAELRLTDALEAAAKAHMWAQDMGMHTFEPGGTVIIQPPKTGDVGFGTFALAALLAGLLLLVSGAYVYRRGRQRA